MLRKASVQEASQQKYPEWIDLVVTLGPTGQVNVMPAGWAMFTSFEPPLYAISIGHSRYTRELLEVTGEFTIAIAGPGMGPAVHYCGTHSGRNEDKVSAVGLATQAAEKINPPLLTEARANLECRVVSRLETGDHTIFVGEVLAAHVADDSAGRLLNFGQGLFALAQRQPGTEYQIED